MASRSWLQALEATRWLSHMSSLLRAAVSVVRYMDEQGRPVLVHCSDGWDRTPQITALAQILLDPHCRTIDVSRPPGLGRFGGRGGAPLAVVGDGCCVSGDIRN